MRSEAEQLDRAVVAADEALNTRIMIAAAAVMILAVAASPSATAVALHRCGRTPRAFERRGCPRSPSRDRTPVRLNDRGHMRPQRGTEKWSTAVLSGQGGTGTPGRPSLPSSLR